MKQSKKDLRSSVHRNRSDAFLFKMKDIQKCLESDETITSSADEFAKGMDFGTVFTNFPIFIFFSFCFFLYFYNFFHYFCTSLNFHIISQT